MHFQDSEGRTSSRAKFSSLTVASIIFAGFAFTLVAPLSVLAQSPSRSAADATLHGEDPLSIYRTAGIDTDQENQIHQLVKDFESESTERMETLHTRLREMRELSLQPLPDETAVLTKQDEINQMQNALSNARVKLLLKIRNLLKPEQRQNLVNLMKNNGASSNATSGNTSSSSAPTGSPESSSGQPPRP